MRHEIYEMTAGGGHGKLYTYLWDNSEELYDGLTRPLILICPGGSYAMTSDREAEAVALKYMVMGYHAAVLRYSVTPNVYPAALLELAEAIRMIRQRSKEWYVDPHKIVVQGFSAGGHLAACLGVFWKETFLAERMQVTSEVLRPDALILSYPVITSGEFAHAESMQNLLGDQIISLREKMSLEYQVDTDTPPTFLWHTYEDETVPVENSLLFVNALRKKGVLAEFHMFAKGSHGMGTAGKLTVSSDGRGFQKECEIWMDLAGQWLEQIFANM